MLRNQYYYNRLALFSIEEEKYQDAVDHWTEAIKLAPTEGSYYTNRARAFLFLGKNEEALADCHMAIERGFQTAYAFMNLGRAYASLGDYEEALINCNKAVGMEPDSLCYCELGKIYNAIGDKKNALKNFNIAFEIGSTNQVASHSNYIQTTLNNDRKALLDELIELEDESESLETLILDISASESSLDISKYIQRFTSLKTRKDELIDEALKQLDPENVNPDSSILTMLTEQFQRIKKENKYIFTKLLSVSKKVSEHDDVLKLANVYNKASIKKSFLELQNQSAQLYEYNKVFYWTLLNYFSAYKSLSTGLQQANSDQVTSSTERAIVTGLKTATFIAGNLPIWNGVVSTVDLIIDGVWDAVKERRMEARINAINKIIMFNRDPDAQLDDELSLCFAKTSVEIAKAKQDEILHPRPITLSRFQKAQKFIEDQIESLRKIALGAKIDLYESHAAALAVKDVSLLLAYFYKNHEVVLESEEPLDQIIKDIVLTGKAEEMLGSFEKNAQKKTSLTPWTSKKNVCKKTVCWKIFCGEQK